MKYKEFRKYLKGTDFNVVENDVLIEVLPRVYKDGLGSVKIAKNTHGKIILPFVVEDPEQLELIKKAIELAETPLAEREEEKKYYLRHRFINYSDAEKYFNYFEYFGENFIKLDDRREGPHYKTKFTEAEIEGLKEKFDTDLRDFKMIEAEEE